MQEPEQSYPALLFKPHSVDNDDNDNDDDDADKIAAAPAAIYLQGDNDKLWHILTTFQRQQPLDPGKQNEDSSVGGKNPFFVFEWKAESEFYRTFWIFIFSKMKMLPKFWFGGKCTVKKTQFFIPKNGPIPAYFIYFGPFLRFQFQ